MSKASDAKREEILRIPVSSTVDFRDACDPEGNPYYVVIGGEVVGRLLGAENGQVLIEVFGEAG